MSMPGGRSLKVISVLCLTALGTSARAQPVGEGERTASRCQRPEEPWGDASRNSNPQGTMLWGVARQVETDENSAVLAAVKLLPESPGATSAGVRLVGGRLEALARSGGAAPGLAGTVLPGTAGDGQPVEVAICAEEPDDAGAQMSWYRIQVWNPAAARWQNPCTPTKEIPNPRAMVFEGVWDAQGTHQPDPGRFTFACETGVIAKCARWGYRPWEARNGQSLRHVHQACTRMARADYCGNGRSHTREGTTIDLYDAFQILTRATRPAEGWNPELGSFEAAWGPQGATCLARTRDGSALGDLQKECPGTFKASGPLDLGEGDRCTVVRAGVAPARASLLRNRSYRTPR